MIINFSKYHGNGNDFIVIDNREKSFPVDNYELVRKLCDRNFGIGADGLMLLEDGKDNDFHMVYYNSDGREGSMCGNGGRCMVRFARELEIISGTAIFSGVDGIHEATIDGQGLVRLKMQDVDGIERDGQAYIINTGSPHLIMFRENLAEIDVVGEGRTIRYSDRYRDKGINVNFVERSGGSIRIRTYERGVENETLACGTGSVAAALAAATENPVIGNRVKIETRGGLLEVSFERKGKSSFGDIRLTGQARPVFTGTIDTAGLIGQAGEVR